MAVEIESAWPAVPTWGRAPLPARAPEARGSRARDPLPAAAPAPREAPLAPPPWVRSCCSAPEPAFVNSSSPFSVPKPAWESTRTAGRRARPSQRSHGRQCARRRGQPRWSHCPASGSRVALDRTGRAWPLRQIASHTARRCGPPPQPRSCVPSGSSRPCPRRPGGPRGRACGWPGAMCASLGGVGARASDGARLGRRGANARGPAHPNGAWHSRVNMDSADRCLERGGLRTSEMMSSASTSGHGLRPIESRARALRSLQALSLNLDRGYGDFRPPVRHGSLAPPKRTAPTGGQATGASPNQRSSSARGSGAVESPSRGVPCSEAHRPRCGHPRHR